MVLAVQRVVVLAREHLNPYGVGIPRPHTKHYTSYVQRVMIYVANLTAPPESKAAPFRIQRLEW